eukprot:m.81401 g.81401  ORF g.81401 m.81401 type:complete len:333 (+) comp14692_c0_seq3:170-1168(+)
MTFFPDAFNQLADAVASALGPLTAQASTLCTELLPAEARGVVRQAGDDVVTFFTAGTPDFVVPAPTADRPFNRLEAALPLSLAYVAFVIVVGTLFRVVFGSAEGGSAAAPAKSNASKKKAAAPQQSVAQKFASEPILILQMIYNLVQVVLCAYMCLAAVEQALKYKFGYFCNSFVPSRTSVADVVYIFYLSKILDFMDTVFIIFRRKWRQLSFLHVYHHFSIFLVYWLLINGGYDGDIFLTVVLNSFIHFVMYSYYFVRTLNIPVPMAIKQLVTKAQMIQFVIMFTQGTLNVVYSCPYPLRLSSLYVAYITSMLVLFQNFSSKTYASKQKTQ